MIYFVLTAEHAYTVRALGRRNFGAAVPPCRPLPYTTLFRAKRVRPGTYIFCDLERLSERELVLAAEAYRALAQAAPRVRVLNDPARVKTRYALLRSLYESGFNGFDAYRADGHPRPRRFPVFIRAETSHEPPLTDLLPTQGALERALGELVACGRPLRGLIVIEYCAEPVAPNIFQRLSMFRLGDAIHHQHKLMGDSWYVKQGKPGLATEEMFREHDREVRENRYAEPLSRAFELSGIEYGRADFGLVAGQPQVYEINTNPNLGVLQTHRSPTRTATLAFAQKRFAELLSALDTPGLGKPLPLEGSRLAQYRRVVTVRGRLITALERGHRAVSWRVRKHLAKRTSGPLPP